MNETRIGVLQDHETDPDLVNYEPVRRKPLWSVFDRDWYLRHYPDVERQMQALGITDPEQFYAEYGARLGHSPNMFFDEAWYLGENPDVAAFVRAGGFRPVLRIICMMGIGSVRRTGCFRRSSIWRPTRM